MPSILLVNKPVGKTPLEAIKELKDSSPELKDKKISYAGRLDPMAEGLLLLLVGDENKQRGYYQGLNKTYELQVIFGIATDSYDLLGLITTVQAHISSPKRLVLPLGELELTYPPFSSKNFKGKPLYYWARQNKLPELPIKKVNILSSEIVSQGKLSGQEIADYAIETITRVKGDFRQESILQEWNNFYTNYYKQEFPFLTVRVSCSSGTYMRSLAVMLGKEIFSPAVAMRIKRLSVGEYKL